MSWGVDSWGGSPWGGGPGDFNLASALHVGPRVLEVRFSEKVLRDAALVDPVNWTVTLIAGVGPSPLTVSRVDLPIGADNPWRVYLLVNETPGSGATYQIQAANLTALDGGALVGDTVTVDTTAVVTPEDPVEDKRVVHENRLGAVRRFNVGGGTNWRALIRAQALIDGVIGGSRHVVLTTGVSADALVVATLDSGVIPLTEVPQGAANGSNRTYRTQHTFDWRRMQPIQAPIPSVDFSQVPTYRDDWYCPGGGYERLFRWFDAPPRGGTTVVHYTPCRGVVRLEQEVACFVTTPTAIDAHQITLVQRACMGTAAAAHVAYTDVYDVWGASFIETLKSALSYRTGVDTLLGIRAKDIGVERQPFYLDDRSFRRVLLNVGTGPKNTIDVLETAFKYLYRDLWKHTTIGEDPRWPCAVAVWYNADYNLRGGANPPAYELWENWLEEGIPQDGADPLIGTYFHTDWTDDDYCGSYFTDSVADPGPDPSYPVILSGDPVFLLGEPIDPPPAAPDSTYRSYIFKPVELERVLPHGVGLLLLKHPGY